MNQVLVLGRRVWGAPSWPRDLRLQAFLRPAAQDLRQLKAAQATAILALFAGSFVPYMSGLPGALASCFQLLAGSATILCLPSCYLEQDNCHSGSWGFAFVYSDQPQCGRTTVTQAHEGLPLYILTSHSVAAMSFEPQDSCWWAHYSPSCPSCGKVKGQMGKGTSFPCLTPAFVF